MQDYYIIEGDERTGPVDMVMLIRKIRNGQVTPDTLLAEDEKAEPKKAATFDSFKEYFEEVREAANQEETEEGPKLFSLWRLLKGGASLLVNYHSTPLLTGVLMLIAFILFFLFSRIFIIGFVIAWAATYILYAGFQVYLLRLTRGQPVDFQFVLSQVRPHLLSLAIAGALIFLPISIGLAIFSQSQSPIAAFLMLVFVVPGLAVITLYYFTAMLITDKNMDFWSAMEASRKTVMTAGSHNLGVIFGLIAINFVGAVMFLIGLLFTLPVTSAAGAEIYDEYFQHLE